MNEQEKMGTSLRSQYADRINYYKRMIQTGSYRLDNLTEIEAYQKLGYWEGRYDELTVGDKISKS